MIRYDVPKSSNFTAVSHGFTVMTWALLSLSQKKPLLVLLTFGLLATAAAMGTRTAQDLTLSWTASSDPAFQPCGLACSASPWPQVWFTKAPSASYDCCWSENSAWTERSRHQTRGEGEMSCEEAEKHEHGDAYRSLVFRLFRFLDAFSLLADAGRI